MIETSDANLSKGIRLLKGIYTQRYKTEAWRTWPRISGEIQGNLSATKKEGYLLELGQADYRFTILQSAG
jgi:hypothetical protein